MAKAWGLLSVDQGERNYKGNAGYDDVPGKIYVWDEDVPEDENVEEGDLVVLRDSTYVLGFAWVDTVTYRFGPKDRFRCPDPHCRSTKFGTRTTKKPKYRCGKCRKPFIDPYVEHRENVKFYEADYERTWQPLDVPMLKEVLEPAFKNRAKQNGIRELDADYARRIIEPAQPMGDLWWESGFGTTTAELPGGHRLVLGKVRVGQQRFRAAMLARFDNSCAISGRLPGGVMDAAHVYRYADRGKHYEDGGLLLRRDLHALFDRWELLIDPDDDWRVWIQPDFAEYPDLWRFNGNELLASEAARPDPEYLRLHAAVTRQRWLSLGL